MKQLIQKARGLTHFISANKLPMVFLAAGLLFVLYQFGGGVVSGVLNVINDSQAAQTEAQANAAEAQAATAITEASAAAVDRKVEDRIRERTIKPEIERTAGVVSHARSRTREAQTNYENSQNPALRPRLDDRSLHVRNCRELSELYPAERFRRCE